MAKQFLEIELDVPDGYVAVRYDFARNGETVLGNDGRVYLYTGRIQDFILGKKSPDRRIILRKIEDASTV